MDWISRDPRKLADDVTGVVLLCAEEDDLELVSWVHNARKHGITPEVVTGVERDDEPLIEALADVDSRLFVVLRSENLDLKRMHELKAVFARHRRSGQELLALRLQPEEAEDAIVKIAARIGRDLRPRTGSFAAVPVSERSGATSLSVLSERSAVTPLVVLSERSAATPIAAFTGLAAAKTPLPVRPQRSNATPQPVFNDSTPVHSGTEQTGTFDAVDDDEEPATIAWMPPAPPPVAEALDWARRATELEITEPLPRVESAPLAAAVASERARAGQRRFGIAALATVTAVVMLGAVVGGVLWMSASEWTSPSDGVPRSTVVAPTDGEPATAVDAPSEARIPSMPRSADDAEPETTTKRPRAKPRSHASPADDTEAGPFDTIEPPTQPGSAPSDTPPSPVAEAQPAPADAAAGAVPSETPSASASTTAAADPRPSGTSAKAPSPAASTVADARPPA